MKSDTLLAVVATVVLFAACRDGESLEIPGAGGAVPKIPVSGTPATSTGGMTSSGTGGGTSGGGGMATAGSGGTGGQAQCDPSGDVVLNELVPNPAGSDAGNEWVELYNKDSSSVDISGWQLEAGTSSYSVRFTLPASTTIAPQAYIVIGGPAVAFADHNAASALTMGNATSSSDAARLLNCVGTPIDTVVYGSPNSDNWDDDSGGAATSLGPTPGSGESLARTPNGADTDQSAADFTSTTSTPGTTN